MSIIVSSHDVHLIERLSADNIIHIRNSRVLSVKPEYRHFSAQIISDINSISDDLKTDLLGSRSEVVFVEGEHKSEDLALYGHVYENVRVTARGGHEKVQEAVRALRSLSTNHWIRPYGLIDGDGRSESEREKLALKGIYTLPCPSIENIFFFDSMISCFIDADISFRAGASPEDRLEAVAKVCVETAKKDKAHIISLRASWLIERMLNSSKISPNQLKEGDRSPINIDVRSVMERVTTDVAKIIDSNDWHLIARQLPIKRTGIPEAASRALGARSYKEYCSVILRQLDIRSPVGKKALVSLRAALPSLDRLDVQPTIHPVL